MTTKNCQVTDRISVSDLVRKCFSAYELQDRRIIEDLLSDDFTFTSPLDERINRAEYFQRCWLNSENIRNFQIEKLFENGNEACVRYQCETKAGKKFCNTEWFRFEGNKLKEVQVFFGSGTKSADKERMSGTAILKLIDDRLKALYDKKIDTLLSERTPDILAFDAIDPLPYIGADTVIARDMDDIITFASPRNSTAQIIIP